MSDKEKKVKMYFKGGKGIKKPRDSKGDLIQEGDVLTFSWFDCEDPIGYMRNNFENWKKSSDSEIEEYINKPHFIVKKNEDGILFGEGIAVLDLGKRMYLHDFCFKETKKINIKPKTLTDQEIEKLEIEAYKDVSMYKK